MKYELMKTTLWWKIILPIFALCLVLFFGVLAWNRFDPLAGWVGGGAEQSDTPGQSAETSPDQNDAPSEASASSAVRPETEKLTLPEATDTHPLREAVTVEGIKRHLTKFQEIAEANNGVRTSGTPGYDASAEYVRQTLEAAGYETTVQTFDFPFFYDMTELEQVAPEPITYTLRDDFAAMTFSAAGEVTAPLQPVDIDLTVQTSSNSGCEAADFADFKPGQIALLLRGICPFLEKARQAEAAGASAVLVFNDGLRPDRRGVVRGTLGEPGIAIPVIGLSFAAGEALYRLSLSDEVMIHVNAHVISETRQTQNVIADTPGGNEDFVVVIGAHLDSVPAGPGIQDNGSGSATNLEIALQLAALGIEPLNKVRFAFWGAEEFGLLGSQHYVEQLSLQERRQIALNLNFDMIASPNYARFVHDGDHSTFSASDSGVTAPAGSGAIEQIFQDYFAQQNLTVTEIPFDGRSDYGSFIQVGIPAGGLFTGAEEGKSLEQVAIYGGKADEAYDACYHLSCDTIENINWQALDEMSDAAAHAALIFAMTDKPVEETVGQ